MSDASLKDGKTWVQLSRRQALTGIGGAVLAGLGYVTAADHATVAADGVVAGGNFEVPSHTLQCFGTLRSIYVTSRLNHAPALTPPGVVVSLLEGTRIDPGTGGESSTDTVRTNLAAVYVGQSLADMSVTHAPALVMTVEDGDRLVVDGEPHQRGGLGGAKRLWGGASLSDVPSSLAEPAAAFTKNNGNRVYV